MDNLELRKIFSLAIDREIEAHEFYEDVANHVDNKDARAVFEQLAKEELGHMEFLEELKENPARMMKIDPSAVDYKVSESTQSPRLSIDMKPADAIALAMKKEQEAVEFYKRLANSTSDDSTRKIFEAFANMELNHKNRLESVFVEIGYPEVF